MFKKKSQATLGKDNLEIKIEPFSFKKYSIY